MSAWLTTRCAFTVALAAAVSSCEQNAPEPRVVIESTRHDFGALWLGEEAEAIFHLHNGGDATLHLGEVRSTCGCLVAKLSANRIGPGVDADVAIRFIADKSLGAVEKKLSIATDDPVHWRLEFTLAADVTPLYEFDPPLLAADDVVLGDARTFKVRVHTSDGSAVHFGPPEALDPGFTARVLPDVDGPPRPLEPAGTADVEISFDGHAHVGVRLFHIVVPTDHARVDRARIPMRLTILPRLSIAPAERVDFGTVRRSQGKSVELRVRLRSANPLPEDRRIRVAVCLAEKVEGTPIAAELTPVEPGREWRLSVTLAPGATLRSIVGRVDLLLDLPDEPPHSLTLIGTITD